jgi:hypothetical protein
LEQGEESRSNSTKEIPMGQSTDTTKDIDILNASLGGEYFGIAAYQAAMGTGLLEGGVRDVAKKFQGDHQHHAERIRDAIVGLGGTPVETKTWEQYAADYPPPPLTNQADILRYAASLEQSGASATVGSVGDLSSPDLVRLAASIAGVEAMHWSVLLGALGEDPVPVSFIPLPDPVSEPANTNDVAERRAS